VRVIEQKTNNFRDAIAATNQPPDPAKYAQLYCSAVDGAVSPNARGDRRWCVAVTRRTRSGSPSAESRAVPFCTAELACSDFAVKPSCNMWRALRPAAGGSAFATGACSVPQL